MTDATAGSATPRLPGRRRRPLGIRGLLSKALFGSVQVAIIAGAFLGGSAVTPVIAANPSANLDQCANDAAPSPNTDGCSANASDWVNGNLDQSKASYFEGDSVPYRLAWTTSIWRPTRHDRLGYDQGGKHAIDYLTTYNRTVATANPCLGVAGCGAPDTSASPLTHRSGERRHAGGRQFHNVRRDYDGGKRLFPRNWLPRGEQRARNHNQVHGIQANAVLAWGGHIAPAMTGA